MAGTLNANQIIPDQGQTLYINGIDYAANVVIGNTNTTIASFSPTGNVTFQGTITANGITSASGNLSVSGAVSATGNVSGNFVTATNNISANNISSSYDITAASFNGGQLAGMRNRIINGAMMIDQRFAGGVMGAITGSAYTIDRWRIIRAGGTSTLTPQQSTVAPAGFTNSLIVTVGSGATPATSEERSVGQVIEGFNVADLGWGSVGASSVTLSFWVRSSVTGTFGVVFGNYGASRSYVASYTINAANTWEYKTVTIPGDTSGTWQTNNAQGLVLFWDLGVGPTYSGSATGSWQSAALEGLTGGAKLSATTGATFYITGVQLEKGSIATPFEFRQYGTELALCQRYYCYWGGTTNYARVATGFIVNSTNAEVEIPLFPVQMRTSPSLGYSAVGDWSIGQYNSSFTCTSISIGQSTPINCAVALGSSGMTANYPAILNANNTINARLTFSAEL